MISPLLGTGTPPFPFPASKCAPPPPGTKGGCMHIPCVWGWGNPNSDNWRKSLALCLLSVVLCEYHHHLMSWHCLDQVMILLGAWLPECTGWSSDATAFDVYVMFCGSWRWHHCSSTCLSREQQSAALDGLGTSCIRGPHNVLEDIWHPLHLAVTWHLVITRPDMAAVGGHMTGGHVTHIH